MTARLLTREGAIIELDRADCACEVVRHGRAMVDIKLCQKCRERLDATVVQFEMRGT